MNWKPHAGTFSIFAAGALFLFLAAGSLALGQDTYKPQTAPPAVHQKWMREHPGELPIWPTPEELLRWDEIGQGFKPTAPPSNIPRNPGEFEPMEGVLIRYPFGISYAVIKEMAKDTLVVTIVANTTQKNTVIQNYQNHGINLNNCDFLIAPSDTYWTRDYGPWFIIESQGTQGIIDTVYNRPRPKDDKIPLEYGNANGIPVYAMDLTTAGGNYMVDGQGTAVMTTLTWKENPGKTHAQIEQMLWDYLGIHTFHCVPDALGQYIEHIDCWAKFLAPDKIMIIEVPPSNSQYDELEDAVDYFSNQTSCYGTPYKIYRVYTPNGQPYVNSLILNHKVLVPQTGSSWDDDAIQSYQEAMPGYTVLGFTGSWVTTDALHCRTMGITDSGMLYIHHIPLVKPTPSSQGFYVEAEVIPYSGGNLVNGTPMLYWRTTGGWNALSMTFAGNDQYEAYIPPLPDGTVVEYYINAQDDTGRDENHPYMGDADPHTFTVYDPVLGSDVDTVSERNGGTVNFTLNAGVPNANRNYLLLGSVSGTTPGTPLPGGQATLPLNWDLFTNFVLSMVNTPLFTDFMGTLDTEGRGAAQANFPPLPTGTSGMVMHFAYALNAPWNFTSNALPITVVD